MDNADIISKLRHIKVSNPRLDLKLFPDFFCAGPQRTGTTWLYNNLNVHPQIFMAAYKELFFFNYLKSPTDSKFKEFFGTSSHNILDVYLEFFKKTPKEFLRKNFISFKYHKQLHLTKVRGEATAAYAVLDEDIIEEIVTLNPDIKIIIVIRDPVERAWSHAKMELLKKKKRRLSEVSDAEFEDFFTSKAQIQRGKFTEIIEKWSSYLKKDNLFIGRFDDIQKRPQELLLEVFSFLGVNSTRRYITHLAEKKFQNDRSCVKMPQKYKELLDDLFGDEKNKIKMKCDQTLRSGFNSHA